MNQILHGDALSMLKTLPDACVQTCVTSPPYYGLRDYGVDGQIGLEETPAAYIAKLVEVFREVWRVLRADGTCWVNLGDSYATTNHFSDKTFGNPAFNANRPCRTGTATPKHGIPRRLQTERPHDDACQGCSSAAG